MTVGTEIDWEAIKQEIVRCFGIPDDLEPNGISAIRAMVFRQTGGETAMVLDIAHGEVGLIGDYLDELVETSFTRLPREEVIRFSSEDIPGKAYVSVERRGDVIVLEYLDVEGLEEKARELTGAMFVLVGNYANRNP